MGDCTVGKELKQSTCRYVKKCQPGWTRNDKYICRKTLRRTGKKENNSPNILTGNVGKQLVKSNSPNENRFGVLRGIFGSPKEKKSDPVRNIFGTPSPSPNGKPKPTKKELDELFESPNEIFDDEPSNLSPKVLKKPKKLITGKVRPLLLKPKLKSRKNFRGFNNLKNSPNEAFDLNTQKQLAYARLRKTKDLKLRERIKQKQREGMSRHARKIAKKYNVEL